MLLSYQHIADENASKPLIVSCQPHRLDRRANPDKLSLASTGTGTVPHLVGVAMLKQAGIRAVHVPYKGSGPALQAMLTGEVDREWAHEHYPQWTSAQPTVPTRPSEREADASHA